MDKQGFDSFVINLDPGAEALSYTADLDIREWITLSDVMEEYGLGPNGAQIVSADLLALNMPKIKDAIDGVVTNYFLIDTPGQMELFTFRSSSVEVIKSFGDRAFIVYMVDSLNALTPYSLTSQLMLSAITQFRFGRSALNVLGKKDLITPEDLENIMSWMQDSDALYQAAMDESAQKGQIHMELNLGFLRVLEDFGAFGELTPVSSKEEYGMEDIYNHIQLVYSGGDELES